MAVRYLASTACVLGLFVFSGCAVPVTTLFNGRDLASWEFVTVPAKDIREVCTLRPDGVIAVTGQPVGFIATTASHENYRLHAEWRWTDKPGNGGVLVHISSGPKDRAWPLSLQIQTKNKSVGDLLPMAGASFAEPLAAGQKTPQRTHSAPDSEKPVGEWNTCDITCRGATIEVMVNGVLQNRVTQVNPHAGRIGFQFEGTPFELRNITLQRLD
jgi:hypothetical protein